jgi:hypothetical protein
MASAGFGSCHGLRLVGALADWLSGDTRIGIAADRGLSSQIGERYYAANTGDVSIAPVGTGADWKHLVSTARVHVSSGATSALPIFGASMFLPLGSALSEVTVSGFFTRHDVTNGSDPGHVIRPLVGGLYRVTAIVSVTGGTPTAILGAAGEHHFPTGVGKTTLSCVTRVAAAGDIGIEASVAADDPQTATVERLIVERVGP